MKIIRELITFIVDPICRALYYIISSVVLLMSVNIAIAQKGTQIALQLSKTDSIIIKYLVINNQFPGHAATDTLNLVSEKDITTIETISIKRSPGRYTEVIAFGANVSHSRNYILFIDNNSYTIIGGESLENNILNMDRYLKNTKIRLSSKERLLCYDILIKNAEQWSNGPQLMDDNMDN